MKKYLLIMTLAVMSAIFFSCEKSENNGGNGSGDTPYTHIPLPDGTRGAVENVNGFALNLYKQISASSDDNMVVSPMSVSSVLAMLSNGDNAAGKDEILTALGFNPDAAAITNMNGFYATLLEYLPKVDGKTKCVLSNSVWSESCDRFASDFKNVVKESYKSDMMSISPSGERGMNEINEWVKQKTDSRISKLLTNPLGSDFAVVNATYFKGEWTSKFDVKNTKEERFSNADGSYSTAQMMYQEMDVDYYMEERDMMGTDRVMVSLPYGNTNFALDVIMPSVDMDLSEFEGMLSASYLANLTNNLQHGNVRIGLPKYEIETRIDNLCGVIENLGIRTVFERGLNSIYSDGSLVSMNEGISVTNIKVDEEGTVASAGTVMGGDTADMPPRFTFNRPFIFMIRETSTGVILFMGKVTNFNH